MASNGRLPWFAPSDLEPAARALYDLIVDGPRAQVARAFPLTDEAGRLHGPFNAMLVAPAVGDALQELGAAIRYRTGLTPRQREIATLEHAVLRRADFEWFAHAHAGKTAGLTDAELAALHDGTIAPTLDAAETLVRELVHTLVRERDLNDDAFAAAAGTLGAPVLMDLIALVGYYDLLALSLRVWRTPLPAGTAPPFG